MRQPPNFAKYGNPGTLIPGSKFRRGYCRVCGEPIRVTTDCPRKAMLGECCHCFNGTRNESGRQRPAREESAPVRANVRGTAL